MTNLKTLITSLIEKKGKFQIYLIILLCLNSIEIGINHTVTSFHIYTPSYYCKDDLTKDTNVTTNCNVECQNGYEFDIADDFSLAAEFQLVCKRKYLAPLLNTLYFVGVTMGSLICSLLCDLWGRKRLVLACMYVQALMSLGLYLSTNLIWVAIFRVLQGFFIQGLQTCSYTLMLEYCPSKFRTIAAVFWELNWAIGLGILGIASYLIPNWRYLTLVLLIPTALSFVYFWIIPESITWLYANKHYSEAFHLIKYVAKKNKDTVLLDECNGLELSEKEILNKQKKPSINYTTEDESDLDNIDVNSMESNKVAKESSIKSVLTNPVIKKHLFVMISVWFSVTLSYYGILYFLPNLAGQRHVNFLVGAAIEGIAYILAYFILSKFGRRLPMTFYQYTNGCLLLVMGFLAIAEQTETQKWFLIIISLIAKGLAVSSFCGMFIYGSELFPTICRGIGLGLCGFSARIGSLLAPQLMLLADFLPAYVPMVIMSVLLIITASATLLLPETVSTALPNTIEEANSLWGKNGSAKARKNFVQN